MVIIAAEPGMGKSMLMTRLAYEEKQKNPNHWIIKIELLNYKKELNELMFNHKNEVMDFFQTILKLTALGRGLLESYLENGKVAFFFDGYDEITNDQQAKIINCVKILKNNCRAGKIVITTRRHMQQELEEAFYIFAYNLTSFTEQDKKTFLTIFWQEQIKEGKLTPLQQKKIENYAESLFAAFSKSIKDSPMKFMGIPLQARLLAESFLSEVKEFCNGVEDVPKLPVTLDINDLYQRFIKRKYEIFFNDKRKEKRQYSEFQKHFEENLLNEVHQRIAISLLFPNDLTTLFAEAEHKLLSMEETRLVGLIQSTGSETQFVHRTFAEYFVAKLLFDLLNAPKGDYKYNTAKEFLFKHIFKARYEVIEQFLEFLFKNSRNQKLIEEWEAISKSDLLKGIGKLPEAHVFSIVEYNEDEIEKPSGQEEDKKLDFDQLFEDLDKHRGRVNEQVAFAHMDNFFQALSKTVDIEKIENSLKTLADMANNTPFEKMKRKILCNMSAVFEHYTQQFMKQQRKTSDFQIKLILAFNNISPNYWLRGGGAIIASSVKDELTSLNTVLQDYKNISEWLQQETKISYEFLIQISNAKILFLRFKEIKLNENGINCLKEIYARPEHNFNFYDFMRLFLYIRPEQINQVKSFLIEKQEFSLLLDLAHKFPETNLSEMEAKGIVKALLPEYDVSLLLRLHDRFNNVRLSENDLIEMYKNKDLLWLERGGIKIVKHLKILNPMMVNAFNAVLDEYKINGYHTGFSGNIREHLIFPLLKLMEKSKKHYPEINHYEFIKMVLKFVKFSMTYNIAFAFTSRQFNRLMIMLETQANHKILSQEMLALTVESLVTLAKVTGCKLIHTSTSLTILDPINEFEYTFALTYRTIITKLVSIKIKDEKRFNAACKAGA